MTYSNVFVILPDEVKNNSRIEINSEDKTLREIILVLQETKLNKILGDNLYERVLKSIYDYSKSNITLPTDIESLIPHIKKYMIYGSISDFVSVNQYKLSNKGTMKLSDNNATSATNPELEWFKSYYDNATISYKEKLIKYLIYNELTLPKDDTRIDDDVNYRGVYLDIRPNLFDETYFYYDWYNMNNPIRYKNNNCNDE